jgi:hypothetical protein
LSFSWSWSSSSSSQLFFIQLWNLDGRATQTKIGLSGQRGFHHTYTSIEWESNRWLSLLCVGRLPSHRAGPAVWR